MAWSRDWRTLFCIWMSNFSSNICQKHYPFSTNKLCNFVEKPVVYTCVGLFLIVLSCFTDLFVSLYATATLSWLLWPYWDLQLCSSFSKLFWIFWGFFFFPTWTLESACQVLQKGLLGFWLGLPWIFTSI